MRDLANLDLLRSVAVILVVIAHLLGYTRSPELHAVWLFGILGVSLFFTHTTLVLMWSLERDPHPLRFYVRRIFRIYPLWLVVLFLSVAVQLPTSPACAPQFGFFHASVKELIENATLTFNLGKGARVIGASWTLPVEVQMYILLPFVFFFLKAYRHLWPLLLVTTLTIFTSRATEPRMYSSLLFCAPLFLPGAMAYILYKKQRPRISSFGFVVWLFFLIAAFTSYASPAENSFRSCWFFTLAAGLTLPFFRQITWAPLCRLTHLIARYSYGIYLCHIAAIAVGVHYLRAYSFATRTAGFSITLSVLSIGFYHAIEKPMIGVGSRIAKRLERGPEPAVDELMLSMEPAP